MSTNVGPIKVVWGMKWIRQTGQCYYDSKDFLWGQNWTIVTLSIALQIISPKTTAYPELKT